MTTDTHFGQREPATSAAEVSAPLSGLTPAQRAALAQMQALPTVLAPIVRIRKEELN